MAYLVRWKLNGQSFPINPVKGALPVRKKKRDCVNPADIPDLEPPDF